jgi:hypothetical protein
MLLLNGNLKPMKPMSQNQIMMIIAVAKIVIIAVLSHYFQTFDKVGLSPYQKNFKTMSK